MRVDRIDPVSRTRGLMLGGAREDGALEVPRLETCPMCRAEIRADALGKCPRCAQTRKPRLGQDER